MPLYRLYLLSSSRTSANPPSRPPLYRVCVPTDFPPPPTYLWENPNSVVFNGYNGITESGVSAGKLPGGGETPGPYSLMLLLKPDETGKWPAPNCGGNCGTAPLVEIGEGSFAATQPFLGIKLEPLRSNLHGDAQVRYIDAGGNYHTHDVYTTAIWDKLFAQGSLDGKYHTMLFTWDNGGSGTSGTSTLFLDGKEEATEAGVTGAVGIDDTKLSIARTLFQGHIAYFAAWKGTALNEVQCAKAHAAGSPTGKKGD